MEATSHESPLLTSNEGAFRFHLSPAGPDEFFFVVDVLPNGSPRRTAESAYERVVSSLSDTGMEIVHERIFGSLSVSTEVLDARRSVLCSAGIPADGALTYIEGHPAWGEGMAGILLHTVSRPPGSEVCTLRLGQSPCGRAWSRDGTTFLLLQNLHGLEGGVGTHNTPALQTRRMIDRAQRVLQGQGASFRDVVRTWFYLSRILDWYGEFNRVRSETYRAFRMMPQAGATENRLPSSTGISGDNPWGAAAVLDLLAVVRGERSDLTVRQLTNPRQLDAVRYGSAFSRGALIRSPRLCTVQLSGTAAIDDRGKSLYPNDVRSQIACTLDTTQALLETVGSGLADIAAATVFVKKPKDALVFRETMARRGMDPFPAVTVVADICRSELLFEIDAEAVCRSPAPPATHPLLEQEGPGRAAHSGSKGRLTLR